MQIFSSPKNRTKRGPGVHSQILYFEKIGMQAGQKMFWFFNYQINSCTLWTVNVVATTNFANWLVFQIELYRHTKIIIYSFKEKTDHQVKSLFFTINESIVSKKEAFNPKVDIQILLLSCQIGHAIILYTIEKTQKKCFY